MPWIVRAWWLCVGLACACLALPARAEDEAYEPETVSIGRAADRPALPRNLTREAAADEAGVEPAGYLEVDGEAQPIPLSPARQEPPLPLAGPGKASSGGRSSGSWQTLGTMLGSLAVVLLLFFGVLWLARRGAPPGSLALPLEVVEVLGRAPLPGRQLLHLVRLGNKLLLLSVSSQGVETLTEITDPLEVDRLAGLCRQAHSASASASFRQLLGQFGGEGRDDTFDDHDETDDRSAGRGDWGCALCKKVEKGSRPADATSCSCSYSCSCSLCRSGSSGGRAGVGASVGAGARAGERTKQNVAVRAARRWLAVTSFAIACFALYHRAEAQVTPNLPASIELPGGLAGGPEKWTSPEGLSSTLQVMLLLTVISLAPALLLMTTSFVRIIVVLGLLRQALGTQQLPPSQVITSIALFLTLLIMGPVWKQVYDEAIVPYTDRQISLDEAWENGVRPVRRFMSLQIERAGNSDDVWLFLSHLPDAPQPESYDEVPLSALLPAFMLSELKTAFLIGFQVYLPFLILDLVISSVLISMGMLMLPPVLVSLPFKLLLFVLVDGWNLVVGMLLDSFAPFT